MPDENHSRSHCSSFPVCFVSIATISKYEKGEIAVALETLIDWCRYLNVVISSLLPGTCKENTDISILLNSSIFTVIWDIKIRFIWMLLRLIIP